MELVQSGTWVFWDPVTSDKIYGPKVFLLAKLNLSFPTSCTIRHISLVPWCVGLDKFHCIYYRKDVFPRWYFVFWTKGANLSHVILNPVMENFKQKRVFIISLLGSSINKWIRSLYHKKRVQYIMCRRFNMPYVILDSQFKTGERWYSMYRGSKHHR